MSKVLLTGFEPFGKASLNPSAEIVKRISDPMDFWHKAI
jgi:pyrrolidone-carboxylate peptidase